MRSPATSSCAGWSAGVATGVRGDTERNAVPSSGDLLANILANQNAVGITAGERPMPAAGSGGPGLLALWVRIGARTGVLLPEVRHADGTGMKMPIYEYVCPACGRASRSCTASMARARRPARPAVAP